ncbi:hypothetical protein FXB40_44730 [Bradyrhizobium rifense]|uniref:Uncharacterized protein n=1 Tax=Bradyrhizobium rifense TaxID=515499 RepID=A0A5D3JZA5_9BRAD|nr:MJ0042-type zinc finger domain-containing protein [Bradyrhizobium rifense]TYL84509.1 hypothetical protein FXB40_44730 [Bradyrhizobium rifense]
MKKSDVTCPECGAGFRRLELTSLPNSGGEYRCPACREVLETFNGNDDYVAYRLTIQPSMKAVRH